MELIINQNMSKMENKMEKKLKIMLAKEWTEGMKIPRNLENSNPPYNPPLGWKASEKKDGYRARYDKTRKKFVSRTNKLYNAPEWYINGMPDVDMDGELWIGREPEDFQKMGAVRKKVPVDEEWMIVKYCVYDFPELNYNFGDRCKIMEKNKKIIKDNWNTYRKTLDSKFHSMPCPVIIIDQIDIKSMEHMKQLYEQILEKKGEGIMFKDPNSKYEDKRSNFLLKYKPQFDSECQIVGYKPGTNKYEGMLGAFICKPLINKDTYHIVDNVKEHEFAISGMDDSIRDSYEVTHPIGTVVTYTYNGFTNSGKPRFARYIRIRDDLVVKDEGDVIKSTDTIQKCIQIFEKISSHEKVNGQHFKSSAYNKAITQLKTLEDDIELTPDNLIKYDGIGKSIIEKIMNIVSTGTCPQYEDIKDFEDPKEIFMGIHEVGPVKAKQLASMGFKTIEDIKNCKTIDNYLNDMQLKGLKYYDDIQKKIPYNEMVKHEKFLKKILADIDSTAELTITGSYRRGKRVSGDIDVLIKSPSVKNTSIYEAFLDKLNESYMVETLSRGKKKFMGICLISKICRRIDVMFTKPEEYPFAILYFTGSKDFNVKMRTELLEKGLSLNEYGITEDKKKVKHDCKTEKDVFKYLGYDYVEPTDR